MSAVAMERIVDALNIGLIVLDSKQQVLLWNDWVARHSEVAAGEAIGKHISAAFRESPSHAFLNAIANTLSYGLPAVLSNALHRSPLALHDRSAPAPDNSRIPQSITLTPVAGTDGARCCLIQISDSSTSIKREKMLRTHSEALKREATTDSLTGIYNRRFFDEHYKMALAHAIRHRLPLSIFMVDIDCFKEYNDCYGHFAGDKTLAQVAATLKTHLLRATDVVARYGGEEFILMLPNMSPDAAIPFAEKLRKAVWDEAIPHLKSHISRQLSISIGISSYQNEPDVDALSLLKSADAALYQAKKNGRNQCHFLPLQQYRTDPPPAAPARG